MYRRIAHELSSADPLERMALIHLVAWQEAPALAPALAPPIPTAWRCRWARWRPSTPHRIVGRHTGSVRAVALGAVDGEPVVVWAARTTRCGCGRRAPGRPCGEPLIDLTQPVYAVALGEVDGEPVVVSGGGDGTVRLWEARAEALRRAPDRPRGVGVCGGAGHMDGEPVVGLGRRGPHGAAVGGAHPAGPR